VVILEEKESDVVSLIVRVNITFLTITNIMCSSLSRTRHPLW
jgi:hypothetical protein